MSFPDFSALNLAPKPRSAITKDAGDGKYCLDDVEKCESSIVILRKALDVTEEQTEELKKFMLDESKVPPTPNPMNRNTNLKRRQTTFGALYNFGQKMASQGTDVQWPEAVTRALEFARAFAESCGNAKELYNGVHTNYYPDGSAGVAPHSDAESDMIRGLPIVSVTLLSGNKKPRPFSIYEKPEAKGAKPEKIADVILGHGDVLIMMGRMQDAFLHGVEPAKPPKDFKNAERLNMTIRAFTPNAVAYAGMKRARE